LRRKSPSSRVPAGIYCVLSRRRLASLVATDGVGSRSSHADKLIDLGTGGYAWAHQEIIRTQQIGTINGATPGTVESTSSITSGWTAGGGIEWAIRPNWSFRAEYLHLDFASQSFTFPLAGQRIDATAKIDVARVGLNYFFDFSRYGPY
jgi:opacity protein-like surface antigen